MTGQLHSAGGSHERPPVLFARLRGALPATMAVLLIAVTLCATAADAGRGGSVPTASTQPAGYRLAGVMRVGNDRIGFLEVPAGGQILVRQGSVVDGGKVTVFNAREMRIVFPTRMVVLELEAGAGQPLNPATAGVVTSAEDNRNIMVRQIDAGRLPGALDATKPGTGAVTGKSNPTNAAAETGRRFAAVFDLPPNARVIAVNEQPVVSADKAIAAVQTTLANGNAATLTLEARPGEPQGRVYLSPKRD